MILMMIHAFLQNRHLKNFLFLGSSFGETFIIDRITKTNKLYQLPSKLLGFFYCEVWRFKVLPNIFCMFDFIIKSLSCSQTATSNWEPVSNDSMTIFIRSIFLVIFSFLSMYQCQITND